MKPKAILYINGTGGHKEQMNRLLKLIHTNDDIKKIALCEKTACLENLDSYKEVFPVRDKHCHLKSIITIPLYIFFVLYYTIKQLIKYNIVGIVSTGPGVVVIPTILFKILGKKVVFIETWSRFTTKSLTGRVMYRLADKFYIQNISLKIIYKNAIYSGRL